MKEIFSAIRIKDKLTIVGTMSALAVVLAVVVGLLTFFTADNHTHVYDYTLKLEEDGSFTLTGLCTVDNCEDPYLVENNLEGVQLVAAVSPTCTKEGHQTYTFTRDGVSLTIKQVLPVTPHTYDYEFVTKGELVHINGMCKEEGCSDPYIFIGDAKELTLVERIEATCFSPCKETYAYLDSKGETKYFTTLVEKDVPHTLNNLPANAYENSDGTYTYGTEGIKLFVEDVLSCGALGEGYYVCEACRQAVAVSVRQVSHKYAYDEAGLVPPTLENDGKAVVNCTNEWCDSTLDIPLAKVEKDVNAFTKSTATETKYEVITYKYVSKEYNFTVEIDYEIGELLTHEYTYDLTHNVDDPELMDLICKCSQPDCVEPYKRVENVEVTFENTSTCIKPGYWIWTHILENGEPVTLTVQSMVTAPHSYEYTVVKKPAFDEMGKATFKCTFDGCNHEISVDLPPLNPGTNATVDVDKDEYITYKYMFTTNYKDSDGDFITVITYVTVDK